MTDDRHGLAGVPGEDRFGGEVAPLLTQPQVRLAVCTPSMQVAFGQALAARGIDPAPYVHDPAGAGR